MSLGGGAVDPTRPERGAWVQLKRGVIHWDRVQFGERGATRE